MKFALVSKNGVLHPLASDIVEKYLKFSKTKKLHRKSRKSKKLRRKSKKLRRKSKKLRSKSR